MDPCPFRVVDQRNETGGGLVIGGRDYLFELRNFNDLQFLIIIDATLTPLHSKSYFFDFNSIIIDATRRFKHLLFNFQTL